MQEWDYHRVRIEFQPPRHFFVPAPILPCNDLFVSTRDGTFSAAVPVRRPAMVSESACQLPAVRHTPPGRKSQRRRPESKLRGDLFHELQISLLGLKNHFQSKS